MLVEAERGVNMDREKPSLLVTKSRKRLLLLLGNHCTDNPRMERALKATLIVVVIMHNAYWCVQMQFGDRLKALLGHVPKCVNCSRMGI